MNDMAKRLDAPRFSLLEEAWLSVAGSRQMASLKDIFSDPGITELDGTPLDRIAALKLLLCIAQRACESQLQNWASWAAMGVKGCAQACLAYLEAHKDEFWLYGPKPFLQQPKLAQRPLEPVSFNFLRSEPSSANGGIYLQTQLPVEEWTDAMKAMGVVRQSNCCFGGKYMSGPTKAAKKAGAGAGAGGSKAAAFPGSALDRNGLLHCFLLGKTLQETVWLNLLTAKDLDDAKMFSSGFGIPPWEQMPESAEDGVAQALKTSLAGRLVGMGRFLLLQDNGVILCAGIRPSAIKETGIADPSCTVAVANIKGEEVHSALLADPSKNPWRSLPAFLGFLNREQPKQNCLQLQCCISRLEKHHPGLFCVWAGGMSLANNCNTQFFDAENDMVDSEMIFDTAWFASPKPGSGSEAKQDTGVPIWFATLSAAIERTERFAKVLWTSVYRGWEQISNSSDDDTKSSSAKKKKKKESKDKSQDIANRAVKAYWFDVCQYFPALNRACAQESSEAWHKVLKRIHQIMYRHYWQSFPDNMFNIMVASAQCRPCISVLPK